MKKASSEQTTDKLHGSVFGSKSFLSHRTLWKSVKLQTLYLGVKKKKHLKIVYNFKVLYRNKPPRSNSHRLLGVQGLWVFPCSLPFSPLSSFPLMVLILPLIVSLPASSHTTVERNQRDLGFTPSLITY